ncbi:MULTISPECIES: hypothetical protein [unclassified Psychrobacter]|uniref:hypothetical protein n=1 Tax=unclassified Psychrobacter TaxID=196806 RepID=UPI0018F7668B|nr:MULTISPECIES: hypothetical protein [unclassified Psychrobacter]
MTNAYILDIVLTVVLWLMVIKMVFTVKRNLHQTAGNVHVLALELRQKRAVILVLTVLLSSVLWFLAWRQYALMQHYDADGISAIGITAALALSAPVLALFNAVVTAITPTRYHSAPVGQTPPQGNDYGGMGGMS